MKRLMTKEFFPTEEIQRMEHELWNLKVKDSNITAYTQRFNELVLLCLEMVPTERKKIKAYICGLSENIKGEVTLSKPANLNEAVHMTHTLMEQKIQARAEKVAEGNKRKWENTQGENMNNNHNNYKDNNHQYQQHNQSKGNARAMTSTQNENADQVGPALKCHRYGVYHFSRCPIKCNKCGKFGQKAKDYRGKAVATVANTQPILVCYEYGEMGHVRNRCPKRNNWPSGNAHGQAYVIKDTEQNQGPNVVTGTFLVNNRYATVLFDSEADKSFVNTSFSHLIDINPEITTTSVIGIRIKLVLGAAPIAYAHVQYRPSKMKELGINYKSYQRGDLFGRAHRLGGAPVYCKEEWDLSVWFECVFKDDLRSGYINSLLGKRNSNHCFQDPVWHYEFQSKKKEKHGEHFERFILELLKKEKLFAKFSKCEDSLCLSANCENSRWGNYTTQILIGGCCVSTRFGGTVNMEAHFSNEVKVGEELANNRIKARRRISVCYESENLKDACEYFFTAISMTSNPGLRHYD
ncbi:putative reverse transcriptase domain-containing protein [Tanacetum coccineum]